MSSPRPPFWLQLRKEYIIDNFDNLVNYLLHYDYVSDADNSDYDSTLECLHQLSGDIFEAIVKNPVYKELQLPYDRTLVMRLLCADILASHKVGQQPYRPILSLCVLFAISDIKADIQTLDSLFNIIANCLRRSKLLYTGFGWPDIMKSDISSEILIYKFKSMRFGSQLTVATNYYVEHNGLVVVPPSGSIDISLVNQSLYVQGKTEEIFGIPGLLKVLAEQDGYEKLDDISRFYTITERILASQSNYRKSLQLTLSEYSSDDCFPVRITSKSGWRVEAETIEPAYVGIKGKLLMELPPRRPKMSQLSDILKVGDIIRVYKSNREGYEFEVYDAFEDFYRVFASTYKARVASAIYVNRYSSGTEWITPDGIRIGIDRSKSSSLDEEDALSFQDAISCHTPIAVRFYNEAPDINKSDFNVYAEIEGFYDDDDDEHKYTQDEAERSLILKFLTACKEDAGHLRIGRCNLFEQADSTELSTLIPLLKRYAGLPDISSMMRFYCITAAAMLAKICGMDDNFTYLEYERSFENATVLFAKDKELKPLSYSPILMGVTEVERKASIVKTLMNYRRKNALQTRSLSDEAADTDKVNRIEALVSASNSLIDIIDEQELNNIKQVIARTLRVEDVYVPIFHDRTYYGVESIGLEFKSTVVFPPENQRRIAGQNADPDLQKWAILKAVCGFLNSRAGGDLLIGVNDAGFAGGIEQDIQELYKMKYISSPDDDHYRLYIMNFIRFAFCEIGDFKPNSDIADSCVDCFPETNAEGWTVMRVKVKPYTKNIVKFAANESRPQNIEDSYLRLSGRTVPVTPGMEEEIMKYKGKRKR